MPIQTYICCHCDKSFEYNTQPVSHDDSAESPASVIVNCQYCGKEVVLQIPRPGVARETAIRGIPRSD